jgi:putative ABC transport system permease protein
MKRLLGIRLSVLAGFYRWRLRKYGIQELLAGFGVAVGVSLVFGVLVANTSIIGSAGQLVHGITGEARLQLAARSTDGLDQTMANDVSRLPGVAVSATLLRSDVAIVGPTGRRRSLQLVGVTSTLAALGGRLTQGFGRGGLRLSDGLTLPPGIAHSVGVGAGQSVRLLARGRTRSVFVGTLLDTGPTSVLSNSPIAIAALPVVQDLTGLSGRVSQVLIEPQPGADGAVRRELAQLAGGRFFVGPADYELSLLRDTARPNDQSTAMFAAIAAMVGFLLAMSAMLLTIPERRRFVAELRTAGAEPFQIVVLLVFDALVLGVVASAAGIVLGDVLCRSLFGEIPAYLAFAFPVGPERVIETNTLLLAFGGGVLATIVASAPPVFDLRASQSVDAVFRETGEVGQSVSPATTRTAASVGVLLAGGATILVVLVPSLTIVGGVTLALAALCFVPVTFAGAASLATWASRNLRGSMLAVAVLELKATTTRAIALASVAAIAVYGTVAIEGAHRDLVRGLDTNFANFLGTADAWVTTGGDDLTTNSFRAADLQAAIAHAPGVASVRVYQGSLLDVGQRRLWIIARPRDDRAMLPVTQLVHGNYQTADAQLRTTGWAAISDGFASSRRLSVGDSFALPTPSGTTHFRVAAITTNLGWPPGGIIVNTTDYRRAWQTAEPSAFEVDFRRGVAPAAGKRSVQEAIGAAPGLKIQTLAEREHQYAGLSRQGLRSLSQISTLLLLAAALAVAAALSAAIWEQRARLADLRDQGADHLQLWRAIMLESGIVLLNGCLAGAVFGIYGHALASRYLKLTTGFPAPFTLAPLQILLSLGILAGMACLVIAVPGFRAASASGPTVS